MQWGWICAAYGKASNADQISVRKLERKRECGGRRSLWEDSFKTDPKLCVTVRSVLMWYRTGCSSWSVLMWYRTGGSSWSVLMWYRTGCSSWSVLMWYRTVCSSWSVLMWYRTGGSSWSVLMWYRTG